jgi:hypothetical protein
MLGIVAAIFAATFSIHAPFTVHTPFVVADNGGMLVTSQPLTVNQVIRCGATLETVQLVHGLGGGIYQVRLSPGFPAGDAGKLVACYT